MSSNLLIVESPAKAKTIESYLGKDFLVKSSYGHIRDLVKGNNAIDIKNDFAQKYEIPDDKKAIVSELKKLSKTAKMVWLASDEDREGEAISWHLSEALDLKEEKMKRIVFHEITKPAILKAIENPRGLDYGLIHAQQARRVLDRLVGFELSPILWKKVKPKLSAGRVQSVAVRLIVEREREIIDFQARVFFKISAVFATDRKEEFKAEVTDRFETLEDAKAFLTGCIGSSFNVSNLEVKPARRAPAAPFTTSTLQQEASRKLGFSVDRTMKTAQKLYESGKITYMRTDSVNLSDTALNAAEREIKLAYGKEYHQIRKYKTKSSVAQEAHEAIRPTYFENHSIKGDNSERMLYELIWKRAIASQMAEAEFERTSVKIKASKVDNLFNTQGQVLKFDGFLKVYKESHDDEVHDDKHGDSFSVILPALKVGEALNLNIMHAVERYTRPPARYTDASLVKKLEELGIGRPSTYVPTISTVQKRGYVQKEDREGRQREFRVLTLKDDSVSLKTEKEITGAEKAKFFPSDMGMVVNDFLVRHFTDIIDYNFTAHVEKEFDDIAKGSREWTDMIKSFYAPFHKNVENTLESTERVHKERELGLDPVSGKRVSVRIGRYGPFVQIGEMEDEDKRFASLRNGQRLDTINLAEALELFKLPRKLGLFEDHEMTVAIGRFGPYVKHNNKFFSIGKDLDPLSISKEQAIEIIINKRKAYAEKIIKSFPDDENVKVLNGRYGPYIAFGKQNVKIPKDVNPSELTLSECKKLAIEQSSEKDSKPKRVKK